MMAFFLLMWLLNATTVQQKRGLADYFDSRIPIARVSGGGRGAFGGDSLTSNEKMAETGGGQAAVKDGRASTDGRKSDDPSGAVNADAAEEQTRLEQIEGAITALAGNGAMADDVLSHVRTRVSPEGLVIEVFDTDGAPLFAPGSAQPTPILESLLGMLSGLAGLVTNDIAITGHTDAAPYVRNGTDGNWALSAERAETARRIMLAAGLRDERIATIAGKAATQPMEDDPTDPRNRRVAITLLRHFPGR
jgi:chemotaxis protein MotB